MRDLNRHVRLYTLRQTWSSQSDSERVDVRQIDSAYIDIFIHDDSPGSEWARQLTKGDIILSRSETDDKHPHITQGRVVLIGDETAFPALAGILEQWRNPAAPIVLSLSSDAAQQGYFDNCQLPEGSTRYEIVCQPEQQAQKVIEVLSEQAEFDKVWAALETDSAKQIRHYLRNERKLSAKENYTKGYWKLNKGH